MEEQDFDKLYGSKLPDFTSADWRVMEGQLDRHDLRRKLTRLMWALPVLGGLLLGVSATLFYQLKQTQSNAVTKLNASQQEHSDAIQLAERNSQPTMDRICESASWETEPTGTFWGKLYDGNAC